LQHGSAHRCVEAIELRLFLDANILFSAAYRDGSPALLLFELAAAGRCQLMTSAFAWDEAHRNIALKCPHRSRVLAGLRKKLDYAPVPDASAIARAVKHGLPEKDAPILASTEVAKVDILVTGDRTHFGHLYGTVVSGLRVLTLSETLARLLEDR
jgi:predicted nucleic acid-binding protein